MADDPEDLEEHRRRRLAEQTRAAFEVDAEKMRRFSEDFRELNKDMLVTEKFTDAVIMLARGAISTMPDYSAAVALHEFLELLKLKPNITVHDLVDAARARIAPARESGAFDEFSFYLNAVARDGMALQLEQGATDGFAGARRSKRESALIDSIERFATFRRVQAAAYAARSAGPVPRKPKAPRKMPTKGKGRKPKADT